MDASQISAVMCYNFNTVTLVGLREMMLTRNTRLIDNYEKIWRKNHNIPKEQPSTLFLKQTQSGVLLGQPVQG